MKIIVIGANGKAGKLIVKEAVERGFEVTAAVRNANKTIANNYIEKDLFAMTKQDLKGYDVVVDAFGAWTEDTVDGIYKASEYLCDLLSGTNCRLIVVGGAGSLYVNKEHTICVADGPDFPDIFKPVAQAHDIALKKLRERKDVNWTYISPACDFRADDLRTGEYLLGGEELILNEKGESIISYADYAIALVDEIEKGKNFNKRISVVRK